MTINRDRFGATEEMFLKHALATNDLWPVPGRALCPSDEHGQGHDRGPLCDAGSTSIYGADVIG